jgi:hypothetical protein
MRRLFMAQCPHARIALDGVHRFKSSSGSNESPLAERLADLLRACESSAFAADKALSRVALPETVRTDIVYRSRFVVVECSTGFKAVSDPVTLRLCAARVACLHARALRDSNADLTNMRDQSAPEASSMLRGADRLTVRTTATVHQERFATVEYKVMTDVAGPIVLWGSAVYRLWAPAVD